MAIKILIKNLDLDNQTALETEADLYKLQDEELFDLRPLLTEACAHYQLDINDGIQYDYWSDTLQTYMLCGTLEEEKGELWVQGSDLSTNKEGQRLLILRLKNRTGNMIDLDPRRAEPSPLEVFQGQLALSLDPRFKAQRNRTIVQALNMVVR